MPHKTFVDHNAQAPDKKYCLDEKNYFLNFA